MMMRFITPLNTLLLGLATVILLGGLLVYIVYGANLIAFPFDYDQGEGFELVDTILFSQFEWPYRDTEAYPFYSSNYPPLFHVIAVPFVWLFGPAYWYGRLLGFLGTLITAGLIAYAVWRDGQHRWLAALAGLAFLSSNTIYHIGPLLRQHMTMVLFETAAVVLLIRAIPQRHYRHILLGFALLICAGYTKQLAAFTALAVLLWFFLRNPRRALLWGLGFAIAGGVIFAWMTWATNGEWWRQAIVANANRLDPFRIIDLAQLWFQLHGFLVIPAAIVTLYEIYHERISLYGTWFAVTMILGGLSAGAWGAGDSYYATSIAAMCILCGIGFSRLWQTLSPRRDRWLLILIPLLFIAYGRATWKQPTDGTFAPLAQILQIKPNVMGRFYDSASYDVPGYANIGHLTTQDDIEAGYAIVEMIRNAEGPVMSEEAGFSLVAGRDVITNPTQLLNLSYAGLFRGDTLVGMIEAQEFALIILRAQFYPAPVLEAIGQHYTLRETIEMNGFAYQIWRPATNPQMGS